MYEVNENFGYQSLNGDTASLVRNRGLYPAIRYHLFFPFLLFPSESRANDSRAEHDHSQASDITGSIVHDNGLFHIQISTK